MNNTHQCTHHDVVSYTDRGVERNKRGCEKTNSYCMQRKGRLKTKNIVGFQNFNFFFPLTKKLMINEVQQNTIMVFSFSLKIGNKFYLKTKLVFLLFSGNFPEMKDCKILVQFCIFLFSVNWKTKIKSIEKCITYLLIVGGT